MVTAAPPARGTVAVLVAIAIPIFTTQLERSRDSVTISNLRAAYAEASSEYLTSNGAAVGTAGTDRVAVAAPSGGKVVVTVSDVVVKGTNTSDLSNLETELPFDIDAGDVAKLHKTSANGGEVDVTFTFTEGADSNAEPEFAVKTT